MRLNVFVTSLVVALGGISDASAASEGEKDDSNNKVTVTGSLIKKSEQEGPAPILTLTAEDFARLGHTNLYDALVALTAQTGSLLEGDQFPNGFTAAAQAINLRGFGPGRTLVLVNGQRFALNPTPYQSESNFFNLATIPTVAIERIDVLTDGASALYGSDAVAGVINIILRDEFDANEVTVTSGDTTRGGGESLKVTGGNSVRTNQGLLTFGYQWEDRQPIQGNERNYLAPRFPYSIPASIYSIDLVDMQLQLPDIDACEPHPSDRVVTAGGDYCTRGPVRDENLRNKRNSFSFFTHAERYTDNGKWYGDFVYWQGKNEVRSSPLSWVGYLFDSDGHWNEVGREFSVNETGNQDTKYDESSYSAIAGFEGFADAFDYRYSFTYSNYDSEESQQRFLQSEIDSFFSDVESVYQVYQPSDFDGVLAQRWVKSNSKSINLSYWMSGEGFDIGDRTTEYALIAEWNKTRYRVDADENSLNFNWYNFGGYSGNGSRDRYALGLEWFFPLVQSDSLGKVDMTLATRWDDYQDRSSVGSASTWKWALQWKPIDSLSINTVKSTSFRAPDMNYLFANSTLYFTSVYDIDTCVNIDGNSFEDCQTNQNYLASIGGIWAGNLDLKEETGSTTTLGLFYSPTDTFSVRLDFYEIELKNQVGLQLESQYLRWEAQCNAGVDFISGDSVDPNSEICQDVTSRVLRVGGALLGIINEPVNRALRRQSGFDITSTLYIPTESKGVFGIELTHSEILKTEVQEIAEEPSTFDGDYENDPLNGEVSSRTNLSLSWSGENWSTAYSIFRKGSKVDSSGQGKISPWTINNFILERDFNKSLNVSLTIRNLFDRKPPFDNSFDFQPYYDRSQYDAIGREFYLTARYLY